MRTGCEKQFEIESLPVNKFLRSLHSKDKACPSVQYQDLHIKRKICNKYENNYYCKRLHIALQSCIGPSDIKPRRPNAIKWIANFIAPAFQLGSNYMSSRVLCLLFKQTLCLCFIFIQKWTSPLQLQRRWFTSSSTLKRFNLDLRLTVNSCARVWFFNAGYASACHVNVCINLTTFDHPFDYRMMDVQTEKSSN
uniref:Uncharacterized protein n=1 Tax=Glossina austeni TaxID=7395 RepID=A0A1A9VUC1_GLOAU